MKWEKAAVNPTLSSLNMRAHAGKLVAVVGAVGSGKSTVRQRRRKTTPTIIEVWVRQLTCLHVAGAGCYSRRNASNFWTGSVTWHDCVLCTTALAHFGHPSRQRMNSSEDGVAQNARNVQTIDNPHMCCTNTVERLRCCMVHRWMKNATMTQFAPVGFWMTWSNYLVVIRRL